MNKKIDFDIFYINLIQSLFFDKSNKNEFNSRIIQIDL